MPNREPLRSLLAVVRRRWRAEAGLRAAARVMLAASACFASAVVVAWLLAPRDGALTLLVAAAIVTAIGAGALIARRMPRRPDDRQVARFIEECVPALDDVLVSAVDESSTDGFQPLVVASAVRQVGSVDPAAIVPTRALRRAMFEAAAAAAACALSIALVWPLLSVASEVLWLALFPASVQVHVVPGDTRVGAGQPLTIRASVRAGRTLLTRFTPGLTVTAGNEERAVRMTPDGEGFQFSFESVDRTFRYHVTAGSARSPEYTVTALFAPRVERIDLRYEYPAFANQPPRDETDGGDIYAPAGTRVRVRVHTDKPIATGEMTFSPRSRPATSSSPLRAAGERVLEGDLLLAKDDSYRIALTDRDGLRSPGETEYFIRVMDDRPPDVRILRPGADQQITPLEEVAIEARADDDYGISQFELVYSVAGRPPKTVSLMKGADAVVANPATSGTARAGTYLLAAEDLRVQPGDVITYYARARDVARGKRPSETRSDMFFLEVRPFSEEFVLAQSQGMAGLASEQIESLIAAQKEIISATWNIERRAASGAGRSADDVQAIANAQSELKTRAEQMTSRGSRGRGIYPQPQRVDPQTTQPGTVRQLNRQSGDPVGAAISAMGKAVDQLQGQRTGDALPHEMAALQGLLQAQAEIRRREVAQQSGSSFGGMGRQGQDLSALFDKELQRQQRTNYETRSAVENRPERQDTDTAADRIRELARRQEDLGRRQRELASGGLPPEEMKRQLEKLTREQEALRQEAEEIAREIGQQTGQQGTQPQRGNAAQGQSGTGEMRDAMEQMRGAAADLQRQSPTSAADRSARAAAGLRRLEQQLRSDSPQTRERVAGELRLEAQQIADEQRRIAGEAERLEQGAAGGNADAWRRLAGEKDKLADRVDALRRASDELSRSAVQPSESGTRNRAGLAGREIERQRIAERMRETAKEMRDASAADASRGRSAKAAPHAGSAKTEQQLARALDQVVDQIGGERVDADELARQLDETRAIRDRLDRLERQVRDAEGKDARGRQSQGRAGASAQGASEELQRAREQYANEMQRARETLSRLERSAPGSGRGGTSPEEHEWSVTDQGTEAFKQDFSKWESLRREVDSALDRYDASVVARAARRSMQDRLNGGGSDRVPDAYRQLIARYYESLARKKQP